MSGVFIEVGNRCIGADHSGHHVAGRGAELVENVLGAAVQEPEQAGERAKPELGPASKPLRQRLFWNDSLVPTST